MQTFANACVSNVYNVSLCLMQSLVQDQEISGNQDLPEGGFDGFLQSLLCTRVRGLFKL